MQRMKMLINVSIIFVLFAGTVFASDTLTGQNKSNYKKELPAKKLDVKPKKDVAKPGGKETNPTATISGASKKQHGDAQKAIDNMKD